jgi:glycerate 2-kinase
VAVAAAKAGVPVVAVAGRLALDPDRLQAAGIAAASALTDIEPDVRRCLADAGPLLEQLTASRAGEWLKERTHDCQEGEHGAAVR